MNEVEKKVMHRLLRTTIHGVTIVSSLMFGAQAGAHDETREKTQPVIAHCDDQPQANHSQANHGQEHNTAPCLPEEKKIQSTATAPIQHDHSQHGMPMTMDHSMMNMPPVRPVLSKISTQ